MKRALLLLPALLSSGVDAQDIPPQVLEISSFAPAHFEVLPGTLDHPFFFQIASGVPPPLSPGEHVLGVLHAYGFSFASSSPFVFPLYFRESGVARLNVPRLFIRMDRYVGPEFEIELTPSMLYRSRGNCFVDLSIWPILGMAHASSSVEWHFHPPANAAGELEAGWLIEHPQSRHFGAKRWIERKEPSLVLMAEVMPDDPQGTLYQVYDDMKGVPLDVIQLQDFYTVLGQSAVFPVSAEPLWAGTSLSVDVAWKVHVSSITIP